MAAARASRERAVLAKSWLGVLTTAYCRNCSCIPMGRLLLPSGSGRCYVPRFLKACLVIILLMSLFSCWLYWDAFVSSGKSAKQLSAQLLRDFPGKDFLKYWEDQGGGTAAEGKAGVKAEIKTGSPPEFHDRLFTPLLETFRNPDGWERRRKSFRNGDVPKVVAYIDQAFLKTKWYVAHTRDIQEGHCPLPCTISPHLSEAKTADAVLIHMKSIPSREQLLHALQPRDPTQPWIMFEAETHFIASTKYKVDYRTLNGVFNRTMYYRRDADILFNHGFIVGRGDDASLLPRHWVREAHVERVNVTGRMAVAFISNCKAHSNRLLYVNELQKYITVDVYGKCGKLKCGKSRYAEHEYRVDKDPCLKVAAEKYLFYLAFENAICDDYATEKLYNMMFYPLVPVVLGGANYEDLLPPNSYIDARQYTPLELAKRLQHLAEHPQEYQSYLEWRKYYQPSTVGGSRVLCALCTRLHDEAFYEEKTIEDFYDWFVTKSHCTTWGAANDKGRGLT
ncbi:alpha-(1,3)-fucosyltransferase C-like isoform X2 [Penaeus monodon]|uniref:alpha-(1,3)-fucosyltransferase C-like isoform X2 n=2 Tax=Penaeus monodon TaxID=6687 RepID=UPI0018A7710B|nr:alpha-(1,3)-fucosyltransferase C-like isoform X2 [Penaeus monodon]